MTKNATMPRPSIVGQKGKYQIKIGDTHLQARWIGFKNPKLKIEIIDPKACLWYLQTFDKMTDACFIIEEYRKRCIIAEYRKQRKIKK